MEASTIMAWTGETDIGPSVGKPGILTTASMTDDVKVVDFVSTPVMLDSSSGALSMVARTSEVCWKEACFERLVSPFQNATDTPRPLQ